MPKPALFLRFLRSSSDKRNRRAYTGTYLERSAPMEDQVGFARYARFTSTDATDRSSNRNYLVQDSMGLSTLQMMLGVYRNSYGSLTRLYTSSGEWSSDRRSCGSSVSEV